MTNCFTIRMPQLWIAASLALAMQSIPAHAQPPIITSDTASIDFLGTDGPTLEFQKGAGVPAQLHFDKNKTAQLRATNSVRIAIVKSNPVLFTYAAKALPTTQTDNAKNAATLGDALGKALAVLSPPPTGGAGPRLGARLVAITSITLNDVDPAQLASEINNVQALWNSIPKIIDGTLGLTTIATAQGDAAALANQLKGNNPTEKMKSLGDTLMRVSIGQPVHWTIVTAGPPQTSQSGSSSGLAALRRDLTGAGMSALDFDNWFGSLTLLQASIPKVNSLVDDIIAFSAAMGKMGDLSLATIGFDASENQSESITVAMNARFEPQLSDKAKEFQKSRVGTYTVAVAPYDWIHLVPSVGVIYSFVKSPSFSSAYNSAGALKINESSTSYAEYTGVVAMDFVPDRYFGGGVEPFGELGVAPAAKNLGFILGVGITAYKSFTFSAGIAYQRVDKLGNGLSVGETIASASALTTQKEWKPGLYIKLGVKLK